MLEFIDAGVTTTPVLFQVIQTPTSTIEKTKTPTATKGASSIFGGSSEDKGNIQGQKNHEGGTLTEEAKGEGEEEGEEPTITRAIDEVKEEVRDVETQTSVALIAEAVDTE